MTREDLKAALNELEKMVEDKTISMTVRLFADRVAVKKAEIVQRVFGENNVVIRDGKTWALTRYTADTFRAEEKP